MSNRRRPRQPTTGVPDDTLAEIHTILANPLDEVVMELSEATQLLAHVDVAELLRDQGADACRDGLKELQEAMADLMSVYSELAEPLGRALTATRASTA